MSRYKTVADIQSKVTERSKQNPFSRIFKDNSRTIVNWRMSLDTIVLVFRVSADRLLPDWTLAEHVRSYF